jgi:type VI secretion system protein
MFDLTLLERLEASTDERPYRAPNPLSGSSALDSVLANLRRIFNERRGSCQTRSDYGMPDLNDVLGSGGTPAQLAQTVQLMMSAFEPRLADPIVRFERNPDDPTAINFRISAYLVQGEDREKISFETSLSPDRRVRVRG